MAAFHTNCYENVFLKYGYQESDITKKIQDTVQAFFYGNQDERIYHQAEDDMGYLTDTGNNDVRTEGMSYGMMFCVQLDMKKEFDAIWKWTKKYMYLSEGENKGYFCWSCSRDGAKNSDGPAPDGEEFFAMALFFASHRWGDGEGIFCYSKEAKELLKECIHKGENNGLGKPMWEPDNFLIKFITNCDWTDPSYHMPHFYHLFSLWSYEEDQSFWKKASEASRNYLKTACHPDTGLSAEYGNYDGTPMDLVLEEFGGRHDWFYSDSYRTVANIAMDYSWFAPDTWEKEIAEKYQSFFSKQVKTAKETEIQTEIQTALKTKEDEALEWSVESDVFGVYLVDGTKLDEKILHPVGLLATIAQAAVAAEGEDSEFWVKKFWNTPLRSGVRRYYDNCLYLFALLALSGNYRIW